MEFNESSDVKFLSPSSQRPEFTSEAKNIDFQKFKHIGEVSSSNTSEIGISNNFVKEHTGLVDSIAASIHASGKVPPCIDFGDLVSWGMLGLIKAKKSFDSSKGASFKTYASYRIKGEILDNTRKEWKHRNLSDYNSYQKSNQQHLASFIEDQTSIESSASPEEQLRNILMRTSIAYIISTDVSKVASETKGTRNPEKEIIDENCSDLWDEIKKLEHLEQNFIKLFYVEGIKQVDIAKRFNCSKSAVCRIHTRVLSKLRRRLERNLI